MSNIKNRGFGSKTLSRKRLLELCSKGGKRAHELGRAHKFTSEEGRLAGRIGGKAKKAKRA